MHHITDNGAYRSMIVMNMLMDKDGQMAKKICDELDMICRSSA